MIGRSWSSLCLLLVLAGAGVAAAQDATMVPVTVDGETVRLEMRVYRPLDAAGRVPTLVFNHGSTGSGVDVSIYTRKIDYPPLARFFTARGWAVVMPARRGRGGSEGVYDEGLVSGRAGWGYACDEPVAIAGADRALRDITAAMNVILAMPFVDPARVMIGGQSRGGVLSVAYAGAHPQQVRGVINFVGGWMGQRCVNHARINPSLFVRGAAYPGDTLWLYGAGDPFYDLPHSRANFAAFQAAGGRGEFHEFPAPPRSDGHRISSYPDMWASVVERYLKGR